MGIGQNSKGRNHLLFSFSFSLKLDYLWLWNPFFLDLFSMKVIFVSGVAASNDHWGFQVYQSLYYSILK